MPVKIDASDMVQKMTHNDEMVYIRTEIAGVDIAHEWESHSTHYVPEEEHYLVGGYTYKITTPPPVLLMEAEYDAVSNMGYHYAEIQHEKKLNHFQQPPKKYIKPGATDHYMSKGVSEVNVEIIYAMNIRSVL